MKLFTSTARRDGRWWVVQCDQEPGALSQVLRLDKAAERQREAIAFVTDLDEADIEVSVQPVLDEVVSLALDHARTAREESGRLQAKASQAMAGVAASLVEDGYSLRDVGLILGVSHQRVAQIIDQNSLTKPPPVATKSGRVTA